jgi:hypothetical protein
MIINSSIKKYKVSFYSEFFESLLDYREGDVIIIDKKVQVEVLKSAKN